MNQTWQIQQTSHSSPIRAVVRILAKIYRVITAPYYLPGVSSQHKQVYHSCTIIRSRIPYHNSKCPMEHISTEFTCVKYTSLSLLLNDIGSNSNYHIWRQVSITQIHLPNAVYLSLYFAHLVIYNLTYDIQLRFIMAYYRYVQQF